MSVRQSVVSCLKRAGDSARFAPLSTLGSTAYRRDAADARRAPVAYVLDGIPGDAAIDIDPLADELTVRLRSSGRFRGWFELHRDKIRKKLRARVTPERPAPGGAGRHVRVRRRGQLMTIASHSASVSTDCSQSCTACVSVRYAKSVPRQ